MTVYYGVEWNEDLRFVIDSYTEERARELFHKGPRLCAVVGEGLLTDPQSAREAERTGAPRPVPEFSLNVAPAALTEDGVTKRFYAGTQFYGEHGSIVMGYDWRQEGDRLFLRTVVFWQYPDDGVFHSMDEALLFEEVNFSLDGTSRTITDDKSKPMLDVVDRCDVDLRANWEPIPDFGDWAGLGRLDRKGTLTRHPESAG